MRAGEQKTVKGSGVWGREWEGKDQEIKLDFFFRSVRKEEKCLWLWWRGRKKGKPTWFHFQRNQQELVHYNKQRQKEEVEEYIKEMQLEEDMRYGDEGLEERKRVDIIRREEANDSDVEEKVKLEWTWQLYQWRARMGQPWGGSREQNKFQCQLDLQKCHWICSKSKEQ